MQKMGFLRFLRSNLSPHVGGSLSRCHSRRVQAGIHKRSPAEKSEAFSFLVLGDEHDNYLHMVIFCPGWMTCDSSRLQSLIAFT
jgi:hypothetical protein